MVILKLGGFHVVKGCKDRSSVNLCQAGLSSIQNKGKKMHLNINSYFLLEFSSTSSR